MKLSELKEIANECGYEVAISEDCVIVREKLEIRLMTIPHLKLQKIEIGEGSTRVVWFGGPNLNFEEDLEMLKACITFAETPLDERKHGKRYYIQHKFVRAFSGWNGRLDYDREEDIFVLLDEHEDESYKIRFTMDEIEEIKENFNTALEDWKILEVKE